MRFIFFVLLCLSTAAFAAQDNPVDALKQSLHKQPAEKTASAVEKIRKTPASYWIDLPKSDRRAILTAWQNLPETTRPPFPVFRDSAMEQGRDAAHSTAAPHATPRIETPAKK